MKAKRSRKRQRDDWDNDDDRRSLVRPPKRKSGAFRKLVYFVVLVAIVVALLPTIVAKTPLRNAILAYFLPSDGPRISVGEATLGWFTAPSLASIDIRDAAGEPLATIESIRIQRTPWSLASNWRDLGEIEVQRPTLYVTVRPDGSNVEDVINALQLKPAQPGAGAGPAAAQRAAEPLAASLRVVDGTIFLAETATDRRWRASNLSLQWRTQNVAGALGELAASGQIDTLLQRGDGTAVANPAGRFAMSLTTAADGRQQAQWQIDALTLDVAQPWLQQFASGAELSGTLAGQGTAVWTAAGPQSIGGLLPTDFATSGTLRIDRLDATVPALAGDRVRLTRVELPWQLSMQPGLLSIERLECQSDIGQIAMLGTIDPTILGSATAVNSHALEAALAQNVDLRGRLDLARVAAMLPRALRIRGDTTITSGTLELMARSQRNDGGQSIAGEVRAVGLAATSGGRPLAWNEPVNATFQVRHQDSNFRLESLKCESEFLSIDAAGTPQQFTAGAEFDLNRLAEQLGQFVDLSGVELAGTGTAHLNWNQSGKDQFAALANSDLSQLRVTLGDGEVWSEPRLAIKAEAAGSMDPISRQPAHITMARVEIDAEGDELNAQLTSPVNCTSNSTTWPVSISVTGNVTRWLTRARPWFSPGQMQIDGQSEATADVRVATAAPPAPPEAATVDVSNAKLSVANLRVVGVGWNIHEPRVELAGDLRWNGARGELAAPSIQFVSSAIALAAKDVRLSTGGAIPAASGPMPIQVNGVAAFRADVARLAAWRATQDGPAPYQPQGSLTGNVRFDQQGDRITGDLSVAGQNLALARWAGPQNQRPGGYATIWQEPQLNLHGTASYEMAADRISLGQLQVQSNTLQASAEGRIDKLSTTADVNATGTVNYDLAQITPLLQPYVGGGVQLVGRETARFQIAGPLVSSSSSSGHWSRTLAGRLEAPWTSANVYGLPIGGGKIAAALGEGAIRVDPLALAVAEGQLTAAPNVRLDPEPMELELPSGPLLTGVRISPEVSEAMLKYIAPVLAGATQSEGKFSLELEGARVPLADTAKADVAGKLTVHSVRVVPGPMAKQWVELAQQVEAISKRRDPTALAQRPPVTLLAVQDQQVNFRVLDGRVYHQGMQFQVGDVTMRSEGSVGLDETLALILHVPIQDKWIEGQALLVGLKGQSLSIPVRGTLTSPRMDQSAIAGLSQQLLQGAAQQAVGNELNKALDKFLKPR